MSPATDTISSVWPHASRVVTLASQKMARALWGAAAGTSYAPAPSPSGRRSGDALEQLLHCRRAAPDHRLAEEVEGSVV